MQVNSCGGFPPIDRLSAIILKLSRLIDEIWLSAIAPGPEIHLSEQLTLGCAYSVGGQVRPAPTWRNTHKDGRALSRETFQRGLFR